MNSTGRVPAVPLILPMGYSPALETEYIKPCINGCECSTIKSALRMKQNGYDIPDNLIEPRRYLYYFNWYPYRAPNRGKDGKQYGVGYGHKEDVKYLICTGCHKPANTYEANKINKVLGFKEPKRVVIPIDLGVFDLL